MKDWIQLPLAAAVAALVGFGSALLATPERAVRGAPTETAELGAAIAELRAEQGQLARRLAALPSAAAPVSARAPAVNLDEAIAAYMARQLTDGSARPDEEAGAAQPADLESAAIADRILSGQVTGEELAALWQKLREEKRIDGVLAEIERQAENAPNNPDLQNELGKAYLQKLFDVGMGPMAAAWGQKADLAFDHALELDETHWEARFHKAVALSNWPAFLGKQKESIHQFELLVEQQEHGVPAPEQAMSYYFLGNLYDQNGDHEKALATWQRGADRFPEDANLRQKTERR